MIIIVTALYCEAKPFIDHYQLLKRQELNKFQVFQNEEIMLLITGTGSISATAAVTYLCTLYPPKESDFLINAGICGSRDRDVPAGSIFLCHKIIEEATGRSFYPDMLFRHSFPETGIVTYSMVVDDLSDKEKALSSTGIFDMEAAGIYQAGSYFFQPHQMMFLKIVSDYGDGTVPEPGAVSGIIERGMDRITEWFGKLGRTGMAGQQIFNSEEEACIRTLADGLRCSVTMELQLRQLLHYNKLVNGSFMGLLEDSGLKDLLPCKSKKEGKIYFEQFKQRLI